MNPISKTPDDSTNDGAGGEGRAACEARMRHAVSAATRGQCAPEELHAAAVQLVSELKNANEPPEQMLLQIKMILAESGLRPTYATPTDPTATGGIEGRVYRDVITWSIRHYYADGKTPDDQATDGRDGDGNKAG